MPIYTVDLSCRAKGHDYTPLFQALRDAQAEPFMDARWLLDVGQDVGSLTSALLSLCAPGDGLFVTELAPETRWSGTGMGEDAKAWFAARMARPEPISEMVPPKRRAPRRRAA